jgi:hypothetical protein
MPNEQTSVPLFVANTVLTASQQNLSAGTGVPVFATTVTRDAAFGGSNKALAEGQLCYLSSTNVVQYYDGAAWATVGPAAAAASGLTCVKAETTFTAATTVTADNVFTSSYTNYLMIVNYTTAGSGDNLCLRLRTGGTAAITNYNWQQLELGGSTFNNTRSTAQTLLRFAIWTNGDYKSSAVVSIQRPQNATATTFISQVATALGGYTTPYMSQYFGNHSTATSYDGIEFFNETASTTTGNYAIYGYSKTV